MKSSKIAAICYGLIFVKLLFFFIGILYFWNTLNDNVSYKTKNTRGNYEFVGGEFKNIQWMIQVRTLFSFFLKHFDITFKM